MQQASAASVAVGSFQTEELGDDLWHHCPMQATIEKASIDEVYIDVTAMVDKELQVELLH